MMRAVVLFALLPACGPKSVPPIAAPPRLEFVDSVHQSRVSLVGIDEERLEEMETALAIGVVVVSYEGGKVRVLRNCRIGEGQYRFEALPLRETASKPDASTRLAVAVHGAKTATTSYVARAQLDAPTLEGCRGATHFVNRVELGAYELSREGASTKNLIHQGSLDACRRVDIAAGGPPRNCRSPLAIELIPISEQ